MQLRELYSERFVPILHSVNLILSFAQAQTGKGPHGSMTSGKTSKKEDRSKAQASRPNKPAKSAKPEWTDGLKQIYDSVLDEPLPDSFNELLAKLDDPSE